MKNHEFYYLGMFLLLISLSAQILAYVSSEDQGLDFKQNTVDHFNVRTGFAAEILKVQKLPVLASQANLLLTPTLFNQDPTDIKSTRCPNAPDEIVATMCSFHEGVPTNCPDRVEPTYCANNETVPTQCISGLMPTKCIFRLMPTHCEKTEFDHATKCTGGKVPTYCPPNHGNHEATHCEGFTKPSKCPNDEEVPTYCPGGGRVLTHCLVHEVNLCD